MRAIFPPSPSRLPALVRVASTAALALVLGGCFVIPRDSDPLDFPAITVGEVQYSTEEVKRQDLVNSVVTYGVFVPAVSQELYFKYRSGQITDVFVKTGERVSKGQVLVTLNILGLEPQIELQRISLEKARVRLELLKATGANRYEQRMAELDVRAAEVQVGASEAQLAGGRLVAPFAGVVTTVNVEEGDSIEPFATALEITDPGALVLECGDAQARNLVVGMSVDVEVDGTHLAATVVNAPSMYTGTSDTARKTTNPRAKSPTVRLMVEGIPRTVKANDLGRVEIVLQKRSNVVAVPKEAVHVFADRTYVYVLDQGTRRERNVETGMETPTEIEILKGLAEGDLVIMTR